ncbi:Retrotransposon Copia-like N-terminal [Arabidopsis thaliana x Arabidopsis arenosa]|uniref:Retrotransposon Copia-like N-terminal n=1 Tax=Arabidopsis thaliana x Arabidopsis arenosa TaxID=1240361 RepID=A0A8T2CGQ8_9BRAS|nr:Retrotransposon Copia-like N-terminal [Arabidopsis thaliana x Arabidopsis arenosa]
MSNPANTSSDPYANPLFLHAADSSSVNLVLEKLTGESNYHTWRRSIIKALNAKNKLGFIDGSITKPPETHAEYGLWTRCNDMLCTWITNSVSKDLGSSTVYFDDAHLLWLNLEGRFWQSNLSKIYSVQDQLDRLHRGSLDLNAYYTRLTTLWEVLKNFEELPSYTCGNCTCGSNDRWLKLYERRNIVRFLMRLNESFTQTRHQILMMDPLPDFTKIYNFVSQDEQQRGLTTTPVPENPVFQASMVARCYKLHGYPPGYKIPLPSGYQGDTSKAKFPQQNGIHMVYSQSPEPNVYIQSPDQQQQMLYVSNPQFQAPVLQNPSSNAFVVSTPVVSTPQLTTHSVNMVNSGRGSPYQVIRPQPVSQHIGSISAQEHTHSPTLIPSNTLNENAQSLDGMDTTLRPRRETRAPSYRSQYHCSLVSKEPSPSLHGTAHPLSAYLSYDKLSHEYRLFCFAIIAEKEPKTFKEAVLLQQWLDAMNLELDALIKYKSDGSIERYKARLVAKGYTQQEGVDYIDTFSPVAKLSSVRLMLALSAIHNWSINQMDVTNAFLHGDLEEEIYMHLPQGYTPRQGEILPEKPVCRLVKSLYGLKQASRQWFHKFSGVLLQNGFIQSFFDPKMFVRVTSDCFLALLVYVDDIMLVSNKDSAILDIKQLLATEFKIKDLGQLRYFLGLEVARSKEGISVSQRKYALELLEEFGFLGCKPVPTPMELNLKLSQDTGDLLSDPSYYRKLIGKLVYLTVTRPDICFAVNKLSQYMSNPRAPHLATAHRILRHLKNDPGQGVFYPVTSSLTLRAYADADWSNCPESSRSISGYCVFLGDSLISWKSKKQDVVSRSSDEAEYRSMANATCELIWINSLLEDLQVPLNDTIVFYCDNEAALHIAKNSVYHEMTKHITRDVHVVRERVASGFLKTLHIGSEYQIADLLTKPLTALQFNHLLSKMGLHHLYSPS